MEHSIATHNGYIIVRKSNADDSISVAQFNISTQGPNDWRPGARLVNEFHPGNQRTVEYYGKRYTSGSTPFSKAFGEVASDGSIIWETGYIITSKNTIPALESRNVFHMLRIKFDDMDPPSAWVPCLSGNRLYGSGWVHHPCSSHRSMISDMSSHSSPCHMV